jgi:hypothetical protein
MDIQVERGKWFSSLLLYPLHFYSRYLFFFLRMEAKLCFWLFHHHTTTVDDVLAPTECTSLGGIFFTIHEEVQEESGGKAILPGMT